MHDIFELAKYVKMKSKQYPQLKLQFEDLLEMAACEIEDGESEYHEVEKAIDDIDQMINKLETN